MGEEVKTFLVAMPWSHCCSNSLGWVGLVLHLPLLGHDRVGLVLHLPLLGHYRVGLVLHLPLLGHYSHVYGRSHSVSLSPAHQPIRQGPMNGEGRGWVGSRGGKDD